MYMHTDLGSFIDQNVALYTYGSGDQNYVFDVGSFIQGSGEYYGSFGNPFEFIV